MRAPLFSISLLCLAAGCSGDDDGAGAAPDAAPFEPAPAPDEWACTLDEGEPDVPDFLDRLGCTADFEALSSPPLDATIPGARSLKSIVDRIDDGLYFQNTHKFGIHWDFASAHLSGQGKPVVPMLAEFNATEYSSPSRRFLLGSITHYEASDIYCYEIAPYDASDAAMIEAAFRKVAENAWFGEALYFHPTSASVERVAADLPPDIPVVTTDQLFANVDYQPLNVASSYGRLVFVTADDLDKAYVGFRDIVVLDAVPNDISVVSGIITEAFQTPLSHINVLSKNRGTPNMALRGAFDDESLRALEGEWVRLDVRATDYSIEKVDRAEADAWWEDNKPGEVQVPGADREAAELADIETLVDLEADDLKAAIKAATRAYGGKAAHYSVLAQIDGIPAPKAFAIPVRYYFEFMEHNGFDQEVDAMLADPDFQDDPEVRDDRLDALRDAMKAAPVDPELELQLVAKLTAEYPDLRMRFRSSTNAEDLEGFTGAGLYTSKSGQVGTEDPVLDAVRKVWASVWNFRAFEERSYRSIDHRAVGMALLVHHSFPEEEANGVALTNNPFDRSGLEPAFYVNVQHGEASVVQPDPDITTDAFLYYYDRPDQPVSFLSHSSEVAEGETVLTAAQTRELGEALDRLRAFFAPIYGGSEWWAMDVEFKFDDRGTGEEKLFIKQARPFQ